MNISYKDSRISKHLEVLVIWLFEEKKIPMHHTN